MAIFWETSAHSVYFQLFIILVISRFGSEDGIWDLIASGPGLCILVTFNGSIQDILDFLTYDMLLFKL